MPSAQIRRSRGIAVSETGLHQRTEASNPRAREVVLGVNVAFDLEARMRDGVALRANVYTPDRPGPWPALVVRLPYSKDDPALMEWLDPISAARCGFIVVVQDTRGRFRSEGEWDPFAYEAQDGHDTVQWAATLSGGNGRVGMFGLSYFGNTQWMAALERPPALAAIAPAMTWCEPFDGLFARGGAVELGLDLRWTIQTGAAHIARHAADEPERSQLLAAITDEYDHLAQHGYRELPVTNMPVLQRHDVPELGSLRVMREPEIANVCRVAGRHCEVSVPTFHIAGWHDVFLQGTLDNYVAMDACREDARLLVGPWTHINFTDPIGDLCYGLRSSRLGAPAHAAGDVNAVQLRWFQRIMAPESDASEEAIDPKVRIFVMGRNEWRDEVEWPPSRARTVRWFLAEDGTMSADSPRFSEHRTQFRYDPADPVPTVGGNTLLVPAFRAGPVDQARVEAREDVCVFTSDALEADLEVTGRVRCVLHAESSAVSTDWVARLCDVHPDGTSYNVCDGIIRAPQARGCQRYEIDLWSTSILIRRGHRLRVHVTSSCFPRWDRNLNTGNQADRRYVTARQDIYHTAEYPSYIALPVIG